MLIYPVRDGLVKNPEDCICSSATVYAGLEGLIDIIPVTFSIKTVKRFIPDGIIANYLVFHGE